MPVFRVVRTITCGFEPGEFRRHDEFPSGFEPARLVADGSLVPVDAIAVVPGMPITAELLADIDDMNEALHGAQEFHERKMADAKAELEAKSAELVAANATITTLSERLAQTEAEAAAKIGELEAELQKARTDLEAALQETANKKKKAT
jgi:hypothetical protein